MLKGKADPMEKLPQGQETGAARDLAAKQLGVSGRTMDTIRWSLLSFNPFYLLIDNRSCWICFERSPNIFSDSFRKMVLFKNADYLVSLYFIIRLIECVVLRCFYFFIVNDWNIYHSISRHVL